MTFRVNAVVAAIAVLSVAPHAGAQMAGDPRVGLEAGWLDAGQAIRNLELVAHQPKPAAFLDPSNPGAAGQTNSDLAFKDNFVFQGTYGGFQVWDIGDVSKPKLRLAFVCPGGQGDVSVHGNLLFHSVEATSGRLDCGTQGVIDTVSAERFRGVRIFDISDIDRPKQVAAIQACRGSHTHTLVTDPKDKSHVYIYISGTSVVRSPSELAGCSGRAPEEDPNTSLFRIDIIEVPLAAPQNARIVNSPRIFADTAGNIAGLWLGGTHGEGTQQTSRTDECHDITAYTQIGLAAGACSGNGILLDISDPVNPKRIAEVADPNFAYWHSAPFSNDGDKVIFTDEWGGGRGPRCQATDRPEWGADAIFTLQNRELELESYYKLPAAQSRFENCVAHNGSLIPVPGRDIFVQAWYQGGISVVDFTNPDQPVEIAFFDRGPMSDTALVSGGYWSAYWYNGNIYGSEMARGLDSFALTPSEFLSQNEIEAARLVQVDELNVQDQRRFTWPASFVVARAYLDQLVRADGLRRSWSAPIYTELTRAEKLSGQARRTALTRLATRLERDAQDAHDAERVKALAATVRELAAAR
ncbi:MAG: LVIVD repeat-containing protein [Gemmatimonadota bacterium]